MALVFYDRVQAYSKTSGTGALTLYGTLAGYQDFSVVGDANTCYVEIYAVDDDDVPTGDWEISLCTYTAKTTTVPESITRVFDQSSNGSTTVSFSSAKKMCKLIDPVGYANLANPSGSIGLSAVNGTATTALRSDGLHALDQAIAPTWTGLHSFSLYPKFSATADQYVTLDRSATTMDSMIKWQDITRDQKYLL